jgi:RNA polymerase sigma factor (sigma-70 family)
MDCPGWRTLYRTILLVKCRFGVLLWDIAIHAERRSLMNADHSRLSDISTAWTLLRTAHAGSPDEATAARELLWLRYGGAVRRYVATAVDDPEDADDLAQEFGLALVRGDFHQVDPRLGRFRDYVKTVLFRMVSEHRQRQARVRRLNGVKTRSASSITNDANDREERFRCEWRDHLLARAWEALAQSLPAQHVVLRFRSEHPAMSSAESAEVLSRLQGRRVTAAGLRQMLVRARTSFSRLLLDEVAQSLETPSAEALQAELAELRLLSYCEALVLPQEPASTTSGDGGQPVRTKKPR